MILLNNLECFVGYLDRMLDIGIGKSVVDKVVVVTCEENASLDALCDPCLMEHHCVVVGNSEVEERRLAGNNKVKSVVLSCFLKTVSELLALFHKD